MSTIAAQGYAENVMMPITQYSVNILADHYCDLFHQLIHSYSFISPKVDKTQHYNKAKIK